MSEWPFTQAELTAGLRRYFAESALNVTRVETRALPHRVEFAKTHVRGLNVTYQIGESVLTIRCVVKELQGATRAGFTSAGLREAGLYRSLAAHLPLATPTLIAYDPAGDWFILEEVEDNTPPEQWRAADFRQAVILLTELHERFWKLHDDLTAYPWLAHPLASDFELYVYAAAQMVEQLIIADRPRLITGSMRVLGALGQIISQAEQVVAPLRAAPYTLLHGDFAPHNLALQAEGDFVVFDWKSASLGPGILDLVAFVMACQWELAVWPGDSAELVTLYRHEIAHRVAMTWTDDEWALLWDHALLWHFTQSILEWVVTTPAAEFDARAERFEQVWLQPVLAATERRLRPMVYIV